MRRLLGGVLAALALALALEWVWPSGGEAGGAVPAARVARQAGAVALPARKTAVWVGAILARPVFSASRRPVHIALGPHGQAAPGQARLAGILITRAGRHAIFAPEGGGRPLVLAEGAAVNDSTIRAIQPDRVVMASGAVLRPTYDRSRVAATSAFQPFTPGFTNPGFPNPGFPNPGFANPGLSNPGFGGPGLAPGFQPGVPPGAAPGEEASQPNVPLLPQGLRGQLIPQRRE